MANLRAGLIGLGMMGRHHARNLHALDGVDLVAVADAQGDPHGVAGDAPLFSSVEELIEQKLDYCVVAVPTHLHHEIGTKLAAAGVHALIEKPLAETTKSAEDLARVFSDAGLIAAVGHIERYNASLQQLRRRIDDGELGDVYQISTFRQGPFPARIADVGVVKDLASHDIDLTSWVMRSGYKDVSARTAHKSGRPHEDMVIATATLENGVIANHTVNWLSPVKQRQTVVIGERGMFIADTLTADLTFYANASVPSDWGEMSHFRGVAEGDVTRFAIPKPEPLRLEHEQFRDAVLGKADADIVTAEQGASVLRVCEAMIESAKTAKTISIGA
ncbi:Gfo/Idh/MocA family protein [Corynebacterium aquilae]|uniref:Dehydrogenase n=1 Tax=Corynebacterium aquilae DSM 44791 TaxID=1431546 RepID=A0A1L7CII1_9CORY|nr:Gfo/Idh/MocA family oxidoreductase [Corynebacterium aquilae]APT85667.1 dehydrogenase [Corynebacterium aquilae DSM 44791]